MVATKAGTAIVITMAVSTIACESGSDMPSLVNRSIRGGTPAGPDATPFASAHDGAVDWNLNDNQRAVLAWSCTEPDSDPPMEAWKLLATAPARGSPRRGGQRCCASAGSATSAGRSRCAGSPGLGALLAACGSSSASSARRTVLMRLTSSRGPRASWTRSTRVSMLLVPDEPVPRPGHGERMRCGRPKPEFQPQWGRW